MHLSRRAKKRLAAAAAIILLFYILTNPTYHSGKPKVSVNGTTDYYEVYYGNRTAGLKESWIELHSPTDLYAYYYCEKRAGLQVGVFVLGFVGEGGTADGETGNTSRGDILSDGNTSAANSSDGNTSQTKIPACIGIVSPIPATGELDPYGTGLRVCYGLRLVESRSCAY